jgi:hypothetical protein
MIKNNGVAGLFRYSFFFVVGVNIRVIFRQQKLNIGHKSIAYKNFIFPK